MGVDDLHPGEQELEVGLDDLVDRDELVVLDLEESRQDLRDLHSGEDSLVGVGVPQPHGDRQAQRRDVRERVTGVDRERREHGEDLVEEPLPQRLVVLGDGVVIDDRHALGGQGLAQIEEDRGVLGDELEHALARLRDLLGGRPSVRRAGDGTRLDLLAQPGDPDLEELIEVAGEDGRELDSLEQRVACVTRLVQHPRIELEPRQLAVQVRELGRCLLCHPTWARHDRCLRRRSWIYDGHSSGRLLDLGLAGEDSTAL
jgi:hypothetical protein